MPSVCVCACTCALFFYYTAIFFHYHGIVGNDFCNVQVEAYYRDFQEQCLLWDMVLKCLLCRFEFQTSKRLGRCRVAVAVASKDEMFANEARGWACCVKAQLHSKFLESGMFERPKNNVAEICPRTLVAANAGLHGEKFEGQVEIFKKLTWIVKMWMTIWNLCRWFAFRFISEGRRRQ